MGKHRAFSVRNGLRHNGSHDRAQLAGALLVGAAALTTGALSSTAVAHATCVSANGIGNGGGCTSSFGTVAVGIGPSATASATGGPFGTAFAVGPDTVATADGTNDHATPSQS